MTPGEKLKFTGANSGAQIQCVGKMFGGTHCLPTLPHFEQCRLEENVIT
jgi:hypothetical protein